MANVKISELSAAGALTGTEIVPIVQSSTTVRTTAQSIANLVTVTPTNTGSLLTTASVNLNTITFTKGNGNQFNITVNTGSGGSGTPGGSNTHVQYNDNGTFNGSTNFTFDETTNVLRISGSLTVTGSLLITGSSSSIGSGHLLSYNTSSGEVSFSSFNTVSSNTVLEFNGQTNNYTLQLSDRGKVIEMNVGSANILTVPSSSTVNFPIGTEIVVVQQGLGQTRFTTSSNNIILDSYNDYLKITGQYAAVSMLKHDTDKWYLIGNMSP